MKILISIKDPDAVCDAMDDARRELKKEIINTLGISPKAAEVEAMERVEEANELVSRYFEYGEYVTIEVDTEEKTVKLVPYR